MVTPCMVYQRLTPGACDWWYGCMVMTGGSVAGAVGRFDGDQGAQGAAQRQEEGASPPPSSPQQHVMMRLICSCSLPEASSSFQRQHVCPCVSPSSHPHRCVCPAYSQEKNIKHSGNITLDEVISIARTMRPRSMARTLAGTVKEILGTAK